MTRALTKGVALAVLLANLPAWAQQRIFTGNAMGVGSGRCATYKMDMEVAHLPEPTPIEIGRAHV